VEIEQQAEENPAATDPEEGAARLQELEGRVRELEGERQQEFEGRQKLAEQAEALRERYLAVLRADPTVVPELIEGQVLEEIEASVMRARTAYERIAARFSNFAIDVNPVAATAPFNQIRVSSGAGERKPPEPDTQGLKPLDKIAYGLALRERN